MQGMALCLALRYSLDDFKQIDTHGLRVADHVRDTLAAIESLLVIPHEELEPRKPVKRTRVVMPPPPPVAAFQTKRCEATSAEKQFNDIRAMVNKLSPKTVQAQTPVVLDAMAKFLFENADWSRRIADMLTSNTFAVKINVVLYAQLCHPDFPCSDDFTSLLQHVLVDEYLDALNNLEAVPSQDDYDAFCDYNKRNDKRKALAAFFGEAGLLGLFHGVPRLIKSLLHMVREAMVEVGRSHQVEEWTENIAVLVTISRPTDPDIRACLGDLTLQKPKDFPSWSSRALFKYMDLVTI